MIPSYIKTFLYWKKFLTSFRMNVDSSLCSCGEHREKFFGVGKEAIRGEDLVSQPEASRFRGIDRFTSQHQPYGGIVSNEFREIDSSNGREDSQVHFWQTKDSIFVG